jgi:hypothetical protein
LIDIFYQEDMFRLSGDMYVQDSFSEKALESRIKHLGKAKESYDKAALALNPRGSKFQVQATEEQIRLLEFQSRLEDQFGKRFLDLSVSDTLYQLIYQGYHRQAETLRKEFHIPDIRYWWTRIQALAAARDWVELEKFSKSKKSPIGYEPFVEACMKFGASPDEIDKYVVKVSLENRIQVLLKIGNQEQAVETAFQLKSMDDLNFLSMKCAANKGLCEKINVYESQLANKKFDKTGLF